MSVHASHIMRSNSLVAYNGINLSNREQEVIAALARLSGCATDRQIAAEMGSADPNIARPRITALIGRGILREVGKDFATGKPCRLVEAVL